MTSILNVFLYGSIITYASTEYYINNLKKIVNGKRFKKTKINYQLLLKLTCYIAFITVKELTIFFNPFTNVNLPTKCSQYKITLNYI